MVNFQSAMAFNQSNIMFRTDEYRKWFGKIEHDIRRSQIKAVVKVNQGLLRLYWQMGCEIVEKQRQTRWGDGFLERLSMDLLVEFPKMKGFSLRNLKYIRQWYLFYCQDDVIGKQLVSQLSSPAFQQVEEIFFSIPWGHHVMILQRCKEVNSAWFYIRNTVENNWSRSTLGWQIDSRLHRRQGKAVNNFANTLPHIQSDLARQMTKDPYVIDLMGVRKEMEEREIENYLDTHVSRFLLELGKGFTFYGRQVQLNIGNESFYVDLLFYHVRLHSYVVVELKASKFKPEHVGQLKFYVSAVDQQFRSERDNPTIGLLVCKEKNDIVAEYSLRGIETPIGISSMKIYNQLMADFKSMLPTIEEIEKELGND